MRERGGVIMLKFVFYQYRRNALRLKPSQMSIGISKKAFEKLISNAFFNEELF